MEFNVCARILPNPLIIEMYTEIEKCRRCYHKRLMIDQENS